MTPVASADDVQSGASTDAHSPLHSLQKLAESRSAEVFRWKGHTALKLYRAGYPQAGIESEFRHAVAAHAAGIPTPLPHAVIETSGRCGIVFERCEGPTLLDLLASRAQKVERIAEIFFELQHAMHQCTAADMAPIEPRLAERIQAVPNVSVVQKDAALGVLERMPRGVELCHGDYHPSNVIMSARGAVVVDWLDAACGLAAYDYARTLVVLRCAMPGRVDDAVRRAFIQRYLDSCRDARVRLDLVELARLPTIVARLAEPVDDAERQHLHALLAGVDTAA